MATYDLNQFIDDDGNIYNFTDDDAQATADAALALATASSRTANGIGQTVSNYVQLGRNLATEFADEIGSTTIAAWLKNRVTQGKYSDLQIGDYVTIVLNNTAHTSMIYQIAGFDQYYGVGDTINGRMIAMVPAIAYPEAVKFNETSTNNGNADETSPWRASGLFEWMNETFLGYLPTEWQAVIKNIRVYNPVRYTNGSTLTADNGGKWMDLGKIWAPSEIEVWGAVRCSTSQNGETLMANTDKQLPIFENGRSVIRSRLHWWERSVAAASSAGACCVGSGGNAIYTSVTYEDVRPLPCFYVG